jgi:acyl-homoserine-lactone acylase
MFWRGKVQSNVDEKKLLASETLSAKDNLTLLQGLSDTMAEMKKTYNRLDIAWGDIYKVGRGGKYYPVDGVVLGSNQRTRTLFNVGAKEEPKGSGTYIANNGSMSMVLMFLHKDGIETYTCTPWGQSADPASPHHTDQAEKLYSQRKFKTVAITPEDAARISVAKVELATQ